MNQKHLEISINVMKRVKERGDRLDMEKWQGGDPDRPVIQREEEMCGTPACFGGWLAVSPEFRAEGGYLHSHAVPVFGGRGGTHAIAEWLGISFRRCADLTQPFRFKTKNNLDAATPITVDHVIAALEALRDA